jgi:hypothetical protein
MSETESKAEAEGLKREEWNYKKVKRDAGLFGRLNGWRLALYHFSLHQLSKATKRRQWPDDCNSFGSEKVLDHVHCYQFRRIPMCLISMPYGRDIDAAMSLAKHYGLEILEPPRARSGWWLPGATYCFAFVRPGTPITWLPEQYEGQ